MKWTDTQRIAEELYDNHPDIDPKTIRFTQLRELILNLPDFDDDPARSGEKTAGTWANNTTPQTAYKKKMGVKAGPKKQKYT